MDLYPREGDKHDEVSVRMGFQRNTDETVYDAMKRIAETQCLWDEVSAEYESLVKDGVQHEYAAWEALYQYDCCEILCVESRLGLRDESEK